MRIMVTVSMLSLSYLLPSLVLPSIITSADALKGKIVLSPSLSLQNHQFPQISTKSTYSCIIAQKEIRKVPIRGLTQRENNSCTELLAKFDILCVARPDQLYERPGLSGSQPRVLPRQEGAAGGVRLQGGVRTGGPG